MPSSYAIGPHFKEFIKRQLASGRYASASEVVRQGLRLLEECEAQRELTLAALRARVEEGAASGEGVPAEEVLARLEAKYVDMS
mgnify:CR=1 FL=1